jgi:hypothetical protein
MTGWINVTFWVRLAGPVSKFQVGWMGTLISWQWGTEPVFSSEVSAAAGVPYAAAGLSCATIGKHTTGDSINIPAAFLICGKNANHQPVDSKYSRDWLCVSFYMAGTAWIRSLSRGMAFHASRPYRLQ